MNRPLQLLLLEDSLSDTELMLYELRRAGFDVTCRRVDNERDFLAALDTEFDLILADYNLPQFTGLRALQLATQRGVETPFILVSGKIGEDLAVEAIRLGATDYLLKDRLARLGAAVEHALEHKRLTDEKKATDAALRAREHSYAELLKNLHGMVYRLRKDEEWLIEYLSEGCLNLTGYPAQSLIGKTSAELSKLIIPDDIEQVIQACQSGLAQENAYDVEYRIVHKAGHQRWMWDRAAGICDESGEVVRIEGLLVDIHERKQAEERINTQYHRLAALHAIDLAMTRNSALQQTLQVILDNTISHLGADAASLLLLEADSDLLRYAAGQGFRNPAIAGRHYRLDESVALYIKESRRLIHFVDAPADSAAIPDNQFDGEGFCTYAAMPLAAGDRTVGVLEVFHRTPRPCDVQWWDFLETLSGQTVIAVDNARLSAETHMLLEKTQAQARLTQDIIDSSPDGMIVLDAQDRLLLVNPAARTHISELRGSHVGDEVTTIGEHPLLDFLPSHAAGNAWQELVWGEPSHTYEVAARELSGGESAGGWVIVVRDVTIDRQTQKFQQLNEHMATVGQLASGIAHDFNNINGAVLLFSELLQQNANLPDQHRRYVEVIHQQSLHAANLIRQILDFSRSSSMQRTLVNFLILLEESVSLLERTLPESIRLQVSHTENDYFINGDPTRLKQIIMNLALNARDAMPKGGTLRFHLTRLTIANTETPPIPDLSPGQWMQFDVSDTGTGIGSNHLPHIFEPFFTTKERGKGSGLGLAQVYGIVKQHEGSLTVESRIGQGTRFRVYLPLFKEASAQEPVTVSGSTLRGAGEVVLLVEDNEAMRQAIQDSVQELGFQVICAGDGVEALELLAEEGDRISIVLTDVVMPRMGGVELVNAIKNRYPELKILLMSGYPLGETRDDLPAFDSLGWINKPFSVQELSLKIEEVVNRPTSSTTALPQRSDSLTSLKKLG